MYIQRKLLYNKRNTHLISNVFLWLKFKAKMEFLHVNVRNVWWWLPMVEDATITWKDGVWLQQEVLICIEDTKLKFQMLSNYDYDDLTFCSVAVL